MKTTARRAENNTMRRLLLPAATAALAVCLPVFAGAAAAQTAVFYLGPQPTAAGSLSLLRDAMNTGNGWVAFTLNCAEDQRQLRATSPVADIESAISAVAWRYSTGITVTGQPDSSTQDITVEQIMGGGSGSSIVTTLSLRKQDGTWCVAGLGQIALESKISISRSALADHFGQQ